MQPDILVFMSDQHSPIFSSYQGGSAETPNLEQLCREGTTFNRAYTSCPLCVPARLSMLTGKLPHKTGILSNKGALSDTDVTYLHTLVQAGYETVLIGRMHFMGSNQRHGFTKRLVGDITRTTFTMPAAMPQEFGVYLDCFAEKHCTDVMGGGNSPVLEYDKQVIKTANEYLSQEHEKPQCMFVSIYAPHFPYVAPEELYLKYKNNMQVPDSFTRNYNYLNPLHKERVHNVSEDVVIRARSSYFGMIELVDHYVGEIKNAFNLFLERRNNQGVFAYISDHGDQAGDRKLFGKRTFFESSARIPLIFSGMNIKKNQKITSPVSIMDLFPTLCELVGIEDTFDDNDGVSLVSQLEGSTSSESERTVISQIIISRKNRFYWGNMAVTGNYKYIHYPEFEDFSLLFDLENDAEELNNLSSELPSVAEKMKKKLSQSCDFKKVLKKHKKHIEAYKLITVWEKQADVKEKERWINTATNAMIPPVIN